MQKKYLYIALLPVILAGCEMTTEEPDATMSGSINDLRAPENFRYTTSGLVSVQINLTDGKQNPLTGVPVEFRYESAGHIKTIGQVVSGKDGTVSLSIDVPNAVNRLSIRTNYVGLILDRWVPVSAGGWINYTISPNENADTEGLEQAAPLAKSAGISAFSPVVTFLSAFNKSGKPTSLAASDVIDAGLLTDINASLPENRPVPQYHPDYLSLSNNTNTLIREQADVWITFVHEGAGWRNSLGFYTFPESNPPTNPESIDSITVIFPNVSYSNSGGGLTSGDKVYLGRFPAGTGIGWVLIANGWNGSTVGSGYYPVFSDPILNSEKNAYSKQHNVFLFDAERGLALLGFEDINREEAMCDHDFNDAVFYVTSNPVTAIVNTDLPPIDKPGDSDGDLVSDVYDDYPNDPNRAFDLFYPAEGVNGTLAFEDQWPNQGDYDFNDLVVRYNFKEVTNANYEVVDIVGNLQIEAAGAAQQNGFGIALPVLASNISSVTGYQPVRKYTNLSGEGFEVGQNQAVVIVTERADYLYNAIPGYFLNTQPEAPFVSTAPLDLTISFRNPVKKTILGHAPYNSFLIAAGDRGREIHLPDFPPTDLANPIFYGTGNDRSDVGQNRYYRNGSNLPWAIQITDSWKWPVEKTPVTDAWLEFFGWAQSGGTQFRDWYVNKADKFRTEKTYPK